MKRFFASMIVALSAVSAQAANVESIAPACTAEEVALATTYQEQMQSLVDRRLQTGEALWTAKLLTLEVKRCAGEVAPADYCTQSRAVLAEHLVAIRRSVEILGRLPASMPEYLRETVRLRELCGPELQAR